MGKGEPVTENERRRRTASQVWLSQLTPEQRRVLEEGLVAEAEAGYDLEKLRPIRGASVTFSIVDEVTEGIKYPCHRDHRHESWCLPAGEMGEALQRAIERRD